MKKIIIYFSYLIVLMLFNNNILQSQNLVPNWSFEDTITEPRNISSCPSGRLGMILWCDSWYSAGTDKSSPDYYKDCGIYNSVPYNQNGYQYAALGNSYTGIIPFLKDEPIQNQKEFIGTKLIEPLIIGKHYFVSFKINYTIVRQIDYAINKIGILLSTKPFNNKNPALVKNFAHIYSDKIITDTLNWTTIKGWITADSVYQFLTIGNFFDNTHTDTLRIQKTVDYDCLSYYYIDDVCVSLDSTTCNIIDYIKVNKPEPLVSAYYNKESNKICISNSLLNIENTEISIYDITGNLQCKAFLNKGNNEIPANNLTQGIYILKIQSTNTLNNFKIFIN